MQLEKILMKKKLPKRGDNLQVSIVKDVAKSAYSLKVTQVPAPI